MWRGPREFSPAGGGFVSSSSRYSAESQGQQMMLTRVADDFLVAEQVQGPPELQPRGRRFDHGVDIAALGRDPRGGDGGVVEVDHLLPERGALILRGGVEDFA